MVRPKDQRIWQHYTQAEDKSVFCKHCDKKYKIANVTKMKIHLIKCENIPYDYKEELTNSDGNTSQENVLTNADSAVVSRHKEDLDQSLALAIYVSGVPLSVVEHPLWKQFINKLNPMYKIPSKNAISTTHLDNAFKNMSDDLTKEIKSSDFLHLQLGGWTDVNNSGNLNFVISKPEPVFIKNIDTTDTLHTSEYLKEVILKVMTQYNESKFVVLIGDNARNIQRAFSLIRETHRNITPLNCIAHTLNLLSNDIMQSESLKAFIDLAVDIVKMVKGSQVLTATLQKLAQDKNVGETLKLPCKTPWGSYHACLSSLESIKSALQSLAIHEAVSGILPSETKATLLDVDFWDMIAHSIKILSPISDVIRKLKSNDCNTSNVFLTLKDTKSQINFILSDTTILSIEDKELIMRSVDHRINMCIKPIHLSAHLLDPRSLGNELNENQLIAAFEYINDMAQHLGFNIMPCLANYKKKKGNVWGKHFIWNNITNIDLLAWWKGLRGLTNLSEIACRILTAPCTSVAVERSFNMQGNIHTKKRNGGTSHSAVKVAYLSSNWNLTSVKSRNEQNEGDSVPISMEPEASTSRGGFEFMDCDDMSDPDSDQDL